MKKYIIKHIDAEFLKGQQMYLQYDRSDGWKHFIFDVNKATRFDDKPKAITILNKFYHPENWKIVGVAEREKKY